jgi:hypothetical protein
MESEGGPTGHAAGSNNSASNAEPWKLAFGEPIDGRTARRRPSFVYVGAVTILPCWSPRRVHRQQTYVFRFDTSVPGHPERAWTAALHTGLSGNQLVRILGGQRTVATNRH